VTAVKVNKKARAAAEAEVDATSLAALFTDADWALDELLTEALDATAKPALDARLAPFEAKLDRVQGKLGLDGTGATGAVQGAGAR
jgi:hypothetical protein